MNDWKMLKITEEDVKNGKRGSACECPIALALHRAECQGGAFKTLAQVRNSDDICIEAKKSGQTISIIEVHEEDGVDIEEFIELFDETGRVVSANNMTGFVDENIPPRDGIVFGFRYRINDKIA